MADPIVLHLPGGCSELGAPAGSYLIVELGTKDPVTVQFSPPPNYGLIAGMIADGRARLLDITPPLQVAESLCRAAGSSPGQPPPSSSAPSPLRLLPR